MRAIIVSSHGGPEELKIEQRPDLEPNAEQVVVNVRAAGVNPVETYQRAGSQGYAGSLPFTPGADGAGVVKAVGSGVSEVSVGQRVYVAGSLTGTYAEQCLCEKNQVYPLPDPLTFEQGAALWINYGTAYRALFQRGAARAGERILVHGATGGVGTAALQWAAMYGLEATGTSGSEAGIEHVLSQGAHRALRHDGSNHHAEVADVAGAHGFDLIIEMLANVNLEIDMGILAQRGRIVVVGSRGSIEVTPRQLMGREADVRGLMLYGASASERQEIHASIAAGISAGVLSPVIQELVPISEAPRAHELVMNSGSSGKIVLVP